MTTVKISGKSQVVVPKEAREHLGVGPGDELLVAPKGDHVVIIPKPESVARALAGSGRNVYRKHGYLKGERRSWKSRSRR